MDNMNIIERMISDISSPGIHPGLDRIKKLLSVLGNPQKDFRTVNVAGTNGKGSVSSGIASILNASGYNTALYTSPHLLSVTERLTLKGIQLSESRWIDAVNQVEAALMKDPFLNNHRPTYFENITAAAFLMARDEGAEIAVLEAGMGGRLDATNHGDNVILSVITSLAEDHSEYLGNTLEEIASEKFAIVNEKGKALFVGYGHSINEQFRNFCRDRHAEHYILDEDAEISEVTTDISGSTFDISFLSEYITGLHTPLKGLFQLKNSSLAVVAGLLLRKDLKGVNIESIRSGLDSVQWPGRMELIFDDPPVILDGAHNPAGMKSLVESIKQLWSGKNLENMTVIYASMKDKDYTSSLKLLASLNSKIYCTEIPDNERSAKSSDIKEELLYYLSKDRISTFCNPKDALLAALESKQPVLICGSLYLVSFIKNTIRTGL